MSAKHSLEIGDRYPWDADDEWHRFARGAYPPPGPMDWAHRAARGVITDLRDRKGIKHGFADIDAETRAAIVDRLRRIILTAHAESLVFLDHGEAI